MCPVYETECPMCGMRGEVNQSYDAPLPACKKCGGKTMRLISTANFSFGWRLTEKSHERFQKDELEPNI